MNFFRNDMTILQAENKLEEYLLSFPSSDIYLKDIPLTEDDYNFIIRIVSDYSKSVYSFDAYQEILLLFIMYGFILSKTNDKKGIFSALFLNNASHIPQHHLRHLVYFIVNTFMEFNIVTFGMKCTSLEDVIHIIKKHSEV